HAAGDGAPDAVGHPQRPLDGEVHQVVRQFGGDVAGVDPERDAVVAFHQGVTPLVVGDPAEGDAHAFDSRRHRPARTTQYRRHNGTVTLTGTAAYQGRADLPDPVRAALVP